jgi:2'-5' RNA ligase
MAAERPMSGSLRDDALFFALIPDVSAASRMIEIGREQRFKHGLTGKLPAPEQLHLPLAGVAVQAGLPSGLVDLTMQAAAAILMPSFDIVLDRARSLGSLRRRLVLCGDEGVSGAVVMQLAVQIATHALGIDADWRRHVPRVTVLEGWRGNVDEAIEPVRWTATEFVLLHRLRERREPVVLGRWPLGKGTGRPTGFEEPAIAIGW